MSKAASPTFWASPNHAHQLPCYKCLLFNAVKLHCHDYLLWKRFEKVKIQRRKFPAPTTTISLVCFWFVNTHTLKIAAPKNHIHSMKVRVRTIYKCWQRKGNADTKKKIVFHLDCNSPKYPARTPAWLARDWNCTSANMATNTTRPKQRTNHRIL